MGTKLTLITATYNSSQFIESCMNSVLLQTYKNIEYIIIDGASKDDTIEKVTKLASGNEFIKVISEPDEGIYDALNKGVDLATGDIIGFVHSDDFLVSNSVLSDIVDVFERKKVDGVYGDLNYVDKDNTDRVVRAWKSCDFSHDLLKKGWMPAHPTLFLNKEVYKKHERKAA